MQRRLESQFDYEKKKDRLQQATDRDNQGKIWIVDNSEGKDEIERTFNEVVSELKVK